MRRQFNKLFKSNKYVNNLLIKLKEHELKKGKEINNEIFTKYPDKKIYKILRKLYKQSDTFSPERAIIMANKIINIVKPLNINFKSLLDYGCSNGTITKELAKQLNINRIYGADIVPIETNDFNFILLKDNNLMPQIKNKSIDLINCSMVLQHVSNINETLSEFKRIISNNGILVIREHDCPNNDFATFLDILHGLYSLVWSEPIEDINFVENYKAYYKTSKEWERLLWSFGFKKIYFLYKKSNINAYYAIYKLINIKGSR